MAKQVTRFGPFSPTLEIGSRNINGGVRDLFPDCTGIDIAAGPGVDIVADAATWKPDKSYGAVVSCEVFEHVENWPDLVATAVRALKRGGLVILTMAGPGREPHSGIDGGPVHDGEFYANVEPHDLELTLKAAGFHDIELGSQPGDLYAVARR